jgi:hypothetical protein
MQFVRLFDFRSVPVKVVLAAIGNHHLVTRSAVFVEPAEGPASANVRQRDIIQ